MVRTAPPLVLLNFSVPLHQWDRAMLTAALLCLRQPHLGSVIYAFLFQNETLPSPWKRGRI